MQHATPCSALRPDWARAALLTVDAACCLKITALPVVENGKAKEAIVPVRVAVLQMQPAVLSLSVS